MMWFIGGINGTGKSTFAALPEMQTAFGVRDVVNPDKEARRISDEGVDPDLANLAAANITQGWAYSAAIGGDEANFAIETVLSSGKFDPVIDIVHQRGGRIGLVYIGVRSVELALARIETRVAAGFHDVPESKVRERWRKTHQSLRRWAPRVDRLLVFSNNYADRPPILIAQKKFANGPIDIFDFNEVPEIVAALQTSAGS